MNRDRQEQTQIDILSQDILKMFMNAPIGIFTSNSKGRFMAANQTMAEMVGYDTPEDLMQSITDISAQLYADSSDPVQIWKILERSGEVVDYEARLQHKDGSIFWTTLTACGIRDDNQKIKYYQWFSRDVTRHKEAEIAMTVANVRLEALWALSSLTEMETKTVADHTLASLTRMTGSEYGFYGFMDETESTMTIHSWSGEAMHNCSMVDKPVYFPIDQSGVWADAVRTRAPLILNDYQAPHPAKKGLPDRHVPLTRLLVVPFIHKGKITSLAAVANRAMEYDQNDVDQITAFLKSVQAIEDGKLAEKSLQESEEKFRTIADFTYDWEYWLNPEGQMSYVSPSCERITGYPADMFMKDPGLLQRIIHQADRDLLTCHSQRDIVSKRDQHSGIDLRIITKNKEVRWISHSCQAVKAPDGRYLGRRGSNRDITARKLAEEEIRQVNQQLNMLNAEKDMLFSIIAHDLKSPMSGLVTTTKMLVDNPELLSAQDNHFILKEMHKNTQNTFSLLEDLLQWARMSQGGIDYSPVSCNLNKLADTSLSTVRDKAKSKEIMVCLDIPRSLTVKVDQPMIKTVFRNILSNAIKFTPRNKKVVITAVQEGPNIRVTIKDNGIGMNEQVLCALFSLKKEKRQLGTEGEKGTGLGLVLCKKFIEQHGGEIWAESSAGQGTTVCFTLPAVS